jgi:hypothetical protein
MPCTRMAIPLRSIATGQGYGFGIKRSIALESETNRSSFVTALAWVFIALAGFSTFISIAQNVMIGIMFNPSHLNDISNAPGAENIPAFFRFMSSHIRLFFFSFLIISSTMLISSIALLKRKNWGRIVFMVIMWLSIAWIVSGVIMQFTMFPQMMQDFSDGNEAERFHLMFNVMRIFMLAFSAAFCGLFGWIIKKLSSESIKREFLT